MNPHGPGKQLNIKAIILTVVATTIMLALELADALHRRIR